LYLVLVTVLGMALALLLRNSALGIVIVLALLLVVPIVFSLIPLDFFSDIRPYLPSSAGEQMTKISTAGDKLNQWQGGLVCAAWAAALLGAGVVLTKIRDV
jgi:ABC-type transport system involved in multi-copper enzyme maturation permease subunit